LKEKGTIPGMELRNSFQRAVACGMGMGVSGDIVVCGFLSRWGKGLPLDPPPRGGD